MDYCDDERNPAVRLFFPFSCDVWPRNDRNSRRPHDTPRWEPAFCVLPGRPAAEPVTGSVDGGLW